MTREELLEWCRQRYGTEPEYPWNDGNVVLRHRENRKWYGVVLEVGRDRLGLDGDGSVAVLNVKCDPVLIGSYRSREGFFPAYHMNKDNWLSILLDWPELDEPLRQLLELSYGLTAPKKREQKK